MGMCLYIGMFSYLHVTPVLFVQKSPMTHVVHVAGLMGIIKLISSCMNSNPLIT